MEFQRRVAISLSFIILVILCSCLTPDPNYENSFVITDNTCTLPCWYGITPGSTTRKEALAIINSLDFIDKDSITELSGYGCNSEVSTLWDFTAGGDILLCFIKDVVQGINFEKIGNLNYAIVINVAGEPDSIYSRIGGEIRHVIIDAYFFNRGMIISSWFTTHENSYMINPDTRVKYISLLPLENFTDLAMSHYEEDTGNPRQWFFDHASRWNGYGEYPVTPYPGSLQ